MILNKYKVWCTVDNVFEYIWLESPNIPTVCPKNSIHAIDTNKTVIVDKLSTNDMTMHLGMSQDWKPYKSKGFQFDAIVNATTIKDFLITDDLFLRGGSIDVYDADKKDYFCVYIVDVDNTLGLGAGYILTEYMDTEQSVFDPATSKSYNEVFNESVSATSLKGLYVRVKYYSYGTVAPFIKLNLKGYQL